jgi:hypothetical protein
VSPVRYELCFYIPEDGILHSDSHENLKSHTFLYSSTLFLLMLAIFVYTVRHNCTSSERGSRDAKFPVTRSKIIILL